MIIVEIIIKFFTWIKEKVFLKEESRYNLNAKNGGINITGGKNIINIYRSPLSQKKIKSKYNKYINKKG